MNWRKPVIATLLRLNSSHLLSQFSYLKSLDRLPPAELQQLQSKRLSRILHHSINHVPYYQKVAEEAHLSLEEEPISKYLNKFPVLTKEIIKKRFDDLKSDDSAKRHPYLNHSGGSSGVPLSFIQDREYSDWNIANTLYYKTFANQEIGDSELRLWGSERDLLAGKEKTSVRLRNWLYHRKEINAFKMSLADQERALEIWNAYQPRWVEAYVDAMYELAGYARTHNIRVTPPKGILVSAGTLYPFMKDLIRDTFRCPVFNRYGSREVGGVACSCSHDAGLHVSIWNAYLEIVDESYHPLPPGQVGRVLVTTLNNYSMSLIRYDIGDYAAWSTKSQCACGRTTPLLEKVEGREMAVFRTRNGRVVPAEFFIHIIGVVYNQGGIKKFQVRQRDYETIEIRVIPKDPHSPLPMKREIERAIKKAMSEECRIDWSIVADIPPLPNGKYLYTICEI